jgi:hypothetical protein
MPISKVYDEGEARKLGFHEDDWQPECGMCNDSGWYWTRLLDGGRAIEHCDCRAGEKWLEKRS